MLNSFKYDITYIDPIMVWLIIVLVIVYLKNHKYILRKPNLHPNILWVLHPNGETYKKAFISDKEIKKLKLSKV